MNTAIMENIIEILAAAVIMLIGVAGTWLTIKLNKRAELGNIAMAVQELTKMSQTTVLELQQIYVDGWKAAAPDGKLTDDKKKQLHEMLVKLTKEKMSSASIDVLNAAGIDVSAIIRGAGEAFIKKMKGIG